MAITYAFCCLFFSALNDFIFKLFANSSAGGGGAKKRSAACGRHDVAGDADVGRYIGIAVFGFQCPAH